MTRDDLLAKAAVHLVLSAAERGTGSGCIPRSRLMFRISACLWNGAPLRIRAGLYIHRFLFPRAPPPPLRALLRHVPRHAPLDRRPHGTASTPLRSSPLAVAGSSVAARPRERHVGTEATRR
jgi:hypothetical protein